MHTKPMPAIRQIWDKRQIKNPTRMCLCRYYEICNQQVVVDESADDINHPIFNRLYMR